VERYGHRWTCARRPGPASRGPSTTIGCVSPGPATPGQIYDVQLARDEAFQDLLVDQRIGETALTIAAHRSARYRLRIRATDPDGGSTPWSGTQHLQSLFLLPAWSLSAPAAKSP
jgi:hypothetical protein